MHIKGNTKNAYPFTKVFLTLSYYDHLVEMIFIWQLAIFRYLIIKALPILYEMHASLFSHSYHIKCRRNLIFTPRIKWFHSDAKIRSILRFIYSHKAYISSITQHTVRDGHYHSSGGGGIVTSPYEIMKYFQQYIASVAVRKSM